MLGIGGALWVGGFFFAELHFAGKHLWLSRDVVKLGSLPPNAQKRVRVWVFNPMFAGFLAITGSILYSQAGGVQKNKVCVRNPTWVFEITCPSTPPCDYRDDLKCVMWIDPRGDCQSLSGAKCIETDRYTEVAARRAPCIKSDGSCTCGEFVSVNGVKRLIDDCQ
jgi:hypothetical protein